MSSCLKDLIKKELVSLQTNLDNVLQRNREMTKELSENEESIERLIHYLLDAVSQQEELERELSELKLLIYHMDLKKRQQQETLNIELDSLKERLQNLSLI